MKYGKIPGLDKPVSRLIQGTVPIESRKLDESFALLDGVFELGCTTFDTAHVYGGGDNERTFGRWIRERGNRDQVVILAKGAHHNGDRKRVTPYDIGSDLHDTLARMQVEYVDLYVLHRDDPDYPVGPIVETLNEYLRAEKIKAFGGSNWSYERIREANDYAETHGLVPFAVSSPNYSLAEQVKEPWDGCVSISGAQNEEARRWYAAQEIPLLTWSSLAGGFFSGRIRRDNLDQFETYLDKLAVTSYAYEENFQRLERVDQLAKEKGATIPQIALAYVLCQPLNIFALTGPPKASEFAENIAALDLELTPQELAWLDLRSDQPR